MKNGVLWAGIMGFCAVAMGAMGAHALKPHISEYQMNIFEKGAQYQFYHSLAILGTALARSQWPESSLLRRAIHFFVGGIFCFSGSLYLLATRDLLPFPVGWAGPVTPIGGVLFMAGWGCLAWVAWQKRA